MARTSLGYTTVRRLLEMAELRRKEGDRGRTVFFGHLAGCGLPGEESGEVYRYFQACAADVSGFPVALDDELGRVLGICGLNVDDAAEEVARLYHSKLSPNAVPDHSPGVVVAWVYPRRFPWLACTLPSASYGRP